MLDKCVQKQEEYAEKWCTCEFFIVAQILKKYIEDTFRLTYY
jgi:hypothetical protein